MSENVSRARPGSPAELFFTFAWIAVQGFGGVLAIIQRVLVERKRWLTQNEFVELFALAQVLPGPNVVNLSMVLGDRFFGWRGAAAASAGMVLLPLGLVLVVTMVYVHYATDPVVARALHGMGAVTAGMIFGTAIKLTRSLRSNPLGLPACLGFGGAAFAAVVVLRLPLVWVLLALGLLACVTAWFRLGRQIRQEPRP